MISIPLLFETEAQNIVDRVLVVDCPETEQLRRVKQRDHLDEAIIRAIMSSQLSRADRLAQADDVIDNSLHDGIALAAQVEKLHNFYQSIGSSLR